MQGCISHVHTSIQEVHKPVTGHVKLACITTFFKLKVLMQAISRDRHGVSGLSRLFAQSNPQLSKGAARNFTAALSVSGEWGEDPLQEVQLLQKDLNAFTKSPNKLLRDTINA